MKRYFNVMGIEAGDIITTSYNTGPFYVVDAIPPRYVTFLADCMFAYEHPVFSLKLKCTEEHHLYGRSGVASIGAVALINGAYVTIQRDHIYVQKPPKRGHMQMDMFSSYLTVGKPHIFSDDVNYETRNLWHCLKCCVDFNGESVSFLRPYTACCPVCHSTQHVKQLFRMVFE